MNTSTLFEEVIGPIKRFMCKLHGTIDDHNYAPTMKILFESNVSMSIVNDQDIVNLLWTMLEELQNVLDSSGVFPKRIKYWMDQVRPTSTKSVQTDDSMVMTDSKIVQITCPNHEFDRRINAFIKRKRMEVDSFNRREFCKVHVVPDAVSCARADAVFVPRQSPKSIIKVKRVFNVSGDREKTIIDLDGLKNWPPVHPSSTILPFQKLPQDLKERCANLHSILHEKKYFNEDSNVYDLLRDLEKRVVYLESLSPEYFHTTTQTPLDVLKNTTSNMSSSNVEDHNILTSPNKDNYMLLDERIMELQKKLLSKTTNIKTT